MLGTPQRRPIVSLGFLARQRLVRPWEAVGHKKRSTVRSAKGRQVCQDGPSVRSTGSTVCWRPSTSARLRRAPNQTRVAGTGRGSTAAPVLSCCVSDLVLFHSRAQHSVLIHHWKHKGSDYRALPRVWQRSKSMLEYPKAWISSLTCSSLGLSRHSPNAAT